jgi:hypothetical protein
MNEAEANFDASALLADLNRMNDTQAALAFRTFERRLHQARYDPSAVIRGFPAQELGVTPETLLEWSSDDSLAVTPLSQTMSASAVRLCLKAAAELPSMRLFVRQAVDQPSDDLLSADLVARLGRLAVVLMLITSTDFTIDFGTVTIHKERLSPESITALSNLIVNIRGGLPPTPKAQPTIPAPNRGTRKR